jgi:hypothetical protein
VFSERVTGGIGIRDRNFLFVKGSIEIPKVNNIHSLLKQAQHVVLVSRQINLSQDKNRGLNQGLKNWKKIA